MDNCIYIDRPKICLEKCDAPVSTLLKTYTVSSLLPECDEKPKMPPPSSCQNDENQTSPSDCQIPEKYRHLIRKSPIVKLTRYENIEETFNGRTSTPDTKM